MTPLREITHTVGGKGCGSRHHGAGSALRDDTSNIPIHPARWAAAIPVLVSDAYGIPDNMFGKVPEEFFGMLGRIVMVASFVELRVLDLLTELEQVPQDVHAGKPGAQLIEGCWRRLGDYDPAFAEAACAVLKRVRGVLHQRNAVVHSIWPEPGVDGAYGWRPVRGGREPSWQPYKSTEVTVAGLRKIIASSVALVDDLDRLRASAHGARTTMP